MKSPFMKTHTLVLCGLFAALITLATCLSIPLPSSIGYIHLGDAMIFIAAYVLGYYGALAAAVGSMLSDLLLGYAFYAPASFIIKGMMAVLAIVFTLKLQKKYYVFAYFAAGLVVPIGYFLLELIFYGFPTAWVNVPFNVLQIFIGSGVSVLLIAALHKTNII